MILFMTYKIAIVDDEKIQRDGIKMYLKNWSIKRCVDISVFEFTSGDAFVFKMADELFDVVILDIEMPGIDGIAVALKIRELDRHAQIIFVTGYSEYIAYGYDVEALNYLIKPLDEDKFCNVLDKALEKLAYKSNYLTLKNENEIELVPFDKIRYLEVDGNYTTIHADKDYMVKRTLSTFEEELDTSFIKISRSYIVALKAIRKVTRKELILSDDVSLKMPRGAYERVNRAIIERL